jgi:threonine dehydrogenase-like Zn-dependent dehydrogenase
MRTLYIEASPARMIATKALGRVWKGAYFSPISPLHFAELPDPPLPLPTWARVRNRLCGICGSDLHQLFLDADLDVAPIALPSHHRIYLGHEMVGTITEMGAEVSGLEVGQRVVRWGRGDDCRARGRTELCPACQRGHRVLCKHASDPREHEPVGGGFGDSFIFPAASLIPVPDALPDEQAIFTEPAAVAIHAAWRRPPRPDEKILLIGCGTIGCLLVQVLRKLCSDCDITALVQFDWQGEMAMTLGADRFLIGTSSVYDRAPELTGAKRYSGMFSNTMLLGGWDVVYDVVGIPATLNHALRWARAGGAVVLVGATLHRMKLDLTPVWYQEVDLIGTVGHDVVTWEGREIGTFQLAMKWMLAGDIRTNLLLTHRFPLDDYRRAFAVATTEKAREHSVKVAFEFGE